MVDVQSFIDVPINYNERQETRTVKANMETLSISHCASPARVKWQSPVHEQSMATLLLATDNSFDIIGKAKTVKIARAFDIKNVEEYCEKREHYPKKRSDESGISIGSNDSIREILEGLIHTNALDKVQGRRARDVYGARVELVAYWSTQHGVCTRRTQHKKGGKAILTFRENAWHGGHVTTRFDTWSLTPGGPFSVMHRVVKRRYRDKGIRGG
uniref:Uncharacterized protein n=1 Tax=Vespula pensylvanica TaxID=30213 RepID=A0A834P726_VESPE|nr:hypothetical protein H0235_004217 [Vespula pensylvanica]